MHRSSLSSSMSCDKSLYPCNKCPNRPRKFPLISFKSIPLPILQWQPMF